MKILTEICYFTYIYLFSLKHYNTSTFIGYKCEHLNFLFHGVWKEFIYVQIILSCIVGKLSKTWTNVLYILQVGTNIIPVSVCGGDNQGSADRNKRKRKGGRNGVASVEPDNTSLGIADHLRYLFSNQRMLN